MAVGFSRDRWYNYIADRSHPPVASAVVEKPEYDPDHVYAWKPANNYKGWKLIDRGEAGVDDAEVIQALDGIADPLKVVIMADIVAKQSVVFEKSKYVDINFLGYTVLNEAGGDYAPFINYRVNNGVFIIRNVTIDNQDTVGNGITAGATDIYPKKVIVENVEVKRFTNHAFYFRLTDPTEAADENAEHDLILKNVRAEATSEGSLNECLTVDNARKVVIEEAELIGNKIAYIVASQTIAKKVKYVSSDWGFASKSRQIVYEDFTVDGTGSNIHLVVEPYISIEGKYQFDSCYLATIRDFRGLSNAARIKLRPYDDSYTLKHVVIDGVTQKQTPIHIEPYTDYATIENLEIRNVKFLEYSLLYHILNITNVSIKKAIIESVELPGINATYTRAIYIKNDKADREINAVIRAITRTLPYVGQSDDKGAGYGVSGEFDVDPILFNNFWQLTSGTTQPKLLKNSGTATFSGDGTTTQFKIAHGLVSTPSKVQVTPMTADAAGDFYVTADDTYIYINYKTAPPSGTDNVKVSWYAEV